MLQLRLESLNFFKGARVGDGGANVIGKNPAPRPQFIRNVVAAKPCDHPQNLAFEHDRGSRQTRRTGLVSTSPGR